MRRPLDNAPTAMGEAETVEERVSLWVDSVGEAARQLGVLVVVIVAARLASNLLFGR